MQVILTAIVPKRISSLKPSKRKIMKSMYATEQFSRKIQKDLPKETRGIAKAVADGCNTLRMKIKN